MAFERRDSSGIAVSTTLNGSITSSSTSFTIANATGWPSGGANGDFFVRIENEIIRCSSRTDTTITVAGGTAGRGQDGTSPADHAHGVTVEFVFTRTDLNEANYAVNQTVGKITGAGEILVGSGLNALAALNAKTSGQLLIGNGTTLASVPMSGDASIVASGALTIVNNAVTLAKMQDISTDRLLGRDSSGTGDPEQLTVGEGIEFTDAGGIRVVRWTDWTPGLSGTGWSLGNGTALGRAVKIGRLVVFEAAVTFGSTSTFGSGALGLTGLPYTCRSHSAYNNLCIGAVFDSSALTFYPVRAGVTQGSTTIFLNPLKADSTYVYSAVFSDSITSTVPFTWAPTDSADVYGFYESST